jgi:dihydroorotase
LEETFLLFFLFAHTHKVGPVHGDTIDRAALCIEGPAFDLLTTLSKFICLGMPLGEVIRTATENPARALKRGDLGTFRKGAAGDASILTLETGRFDYVDSTGEHLEGEKRLTANGVIIGGAVFAA